MQRAPARRRRRTPRRHPTPRSEHHAARLGGDQRSRGVVPSAQAGLEVRVQTSGGDRAQVEARRAHPSDVGDPRKQPSHGGRLPGASLRLVAESGAHHHALGRDVARAGDRRPIYVRPGPAPGVEQLAGGGIADRSGHHLAAQFGGHGDGVVRQAEDEVDGAVDRIEDPSHRVVPVSRDTPLLAQHGVRGTERGDSLAQPVLGQPVDVGDQVGDSALRVHLMTPLGMRGYQRRSTGGKVSGKIPETGDELVATTFAPARCAHRPIAPRTRPGPVRWVAIGSNRGWRRL